MDIQNAETKDLSAREEEVIDAELSVAERVGRRGDGGVYLVVADESDEFNLALRYAARMAQSNRGHVGILHVISLDDVQQWSGVENRMKRELREQSEKFIWSMAKRVNELNGMIPAIYVREGDAKHDVMIDLINEDMTIKMLVLAASASSSGPGPTVAYFTGKGLAKMRVPVVVVPGHLESQKIDAITS